MNLKSIIVITCLIVSASLFWSCSKDKDDDKNGVGTSQTTILSRQRYTFDNLVKAASSGIYIKSYVGNSETVSSIINGMFSTVTGMKKYRLDTAFAHRSNVPMRQYTRDWHIESFTFSYPTVTSSGQPVMLSGRVTFPAANDGGSSKVESISLYVHHYVGSELAPSQCITPLTLRTIYNSAVVEPDLQGYGIDTVNAYCGLSNDAQARQIKDCLFAAMQVMSQSGVTLADDGYTTLWTYSLGTPAAMAFIRMHDEQFSDAERNSIRLHSAFLGGGPMRMDKIVYFFDQNPNFSARLMRYSIHFFTALPPSYLGQYQLRDFAPEWMHNYIVRFRERNYTFFNALCLSSDVADGWPKVYDANKLSNTLASDMFSADGHLDFSNPKTATLFSAMRRISEWNNWSPSVDVYVSHGTDDDAMPYEQAHTAFLEMNANGTIHWKDTKAGLLGVALGANHMALTILGSGCMLLYNTPAEAFRKGI